MHKLDKIFPMARLSRMCGGGEPHWPLTLDKWLYGVPFALVTLLFAPWWCALVAFATAEFGKRTGHGRGMSLEENPMKPGSEPEMVEKITQSYRWLLPRIPLRAYKLFVLWLTQFALISGAWFAAIYTGNLLIAGALVIASTSKPVAYALGFSDHAWLEKLPSDLREKTAKGEYLVGAFDQLSLIAITVIAAIAILIKML